jgi:type IV secretion system protein VirB10
MRDIMSPSASPDGIFVEHGKLGITRINKRIVGIALIVFGGAAIILLATISNHGKSSGGVDGSAPVAEQKALAASPPAIKEAALNKGGLANSAGTGAAPSYQGAPPASPQAQTDELEFQREIRRHEHQQYMARLQRRDAAHLAPMEIKGGVADGSGQAPGIQQALQAEGQEVSMLQRFAEGGGDAGIGTRLNSTLADASNDPNLQGRKESFFNQQVVSNYLPHKKVAPISPYEVKQGTVIPGVMITGINSDLPGQIIGQVSQNVYDSVTGKNLLIPQGTKIVGSYDSFVAVGQERALVAWRRLVFPDGMAIDLLGMSGADQGGYSGLGDQVNNHYFKIFGSALMLSLVGAGYQISQPQHEGRQFPSNQDIIAAEVGRQFAQVSNEIIRRNMQVQPTIEIRPGGRFNIMVNKDMVLEPYVESE